MPRPLPAGSYHSKEEALAAFREEYDNVKDEHVVFCVDINCWIHSDEAYQCGRCEDYCWDGLEIYDDGLCFSCWEDS